MYAILILWSHIYAVIIAVIWQACYIAEGTMCDTLATVNEPVVLET